MPTTCKSVWRFLRLSSESAQISSSDSAQKGLYAMEKVTGTPKLIELIHCYDYEAVCPHDSLRFKSLEEWKSHHLANHMDTKWNCPLCGHESRSWYNYSYHVQIERHRSVCLPPWICILDRFEHPHSDDHAIYCGARFGSKYQLIRHIRGCHANYRVECDVS